MKKFLFFLSFIICTLQLNAMIVNNSHDYDTIPPEIQCKIIDCVTQNASPQKPKDASRTINTLTRVNSLFNSHINDPKFSDKLIHFFAHKYHCSHQTIARYLHTEQSKKRLFLQYKLKRLCCLDQDINLLPTLTDLISQGVNLEFTYNHNNTQKTPLMIAMHYNNNMFQSLLEHGANINGCNTHGITALHQAANRPINMQYLTQLTSNPAVAINQRNNRGETALLHCLTHRKRSFINGWFIEAVKKLIDAGVDPEMTNIKGLTPLIAAQRLRKQTIIRMIQNALNAIHKAHEL